MEPAVIVLLIIKAYIAKSALLAGYHIRFDFSKGKRLIRDLSIA